VLLIIDHQPGYYFMSARRLLLLTAMLLCPFTLHAQAPQIGYKGDLDVDTLPSVADGFEVNFMVKEPHIINPAALCFDRKGRLYVGAGPQYRGPKEDSPTDYIKILIDKDDDGVAEEVKTFAEGFNCIQAMAWKGDNLWVANAPDLTILRDTDGDDVADEYQMVYTGLGSLRHGLHGFNWGPDGWLYMSTGNTWVEKYAPKPFRDLQGIQSDDKTEYPLTKVYNKDTYPKSYHPMNKREMEGGILRCRPGGHDLEIWARGMRNPWDICFDSTFTWLGTDNDPGQPGERIFSPMQYGHYTMRHSWVFDWMGKHPAVAPSADLFPGVSGSGTGVVYNTSSHYPKDIQDQYFIADWTNNCIFMYKPKWDGANQVPAVEKVKIVDGGKTRAGDLGYKGGKGVSLFRPTDIEIGPSGALFIAGWGSVYGTNYVPKDKWTAEENAKYQGRVFRVRHKNDLIPRSEWYPAKRDKKISAWTFDELLADMGHQVQVWRVDAQDELLRRGTKVRAELIKAIDSGKLSESQATWCMWTLGRIDGKANTKTTLAYAVGEKTTTVNLRVQATRVLGEVGAIDTIPQLIELLGDTEPRVRLAAIQSLGATGFGERSTAVLEALKNEKDRCARYTAWQVLRRQLSKEAMTSLLADERPNIRYMALLGLVEDKQVDASVILPLRADADPEVADMARQWLRKSGADKVELTLTVDQPNFRDKTTVRAKLQAKGKFDLRYTLDGSEPNADSETYSKPFTIDSDTTVTMAPFSGKSAIAKPQRVVAHKITDAEWKDRLFAMSIKAKSKEKYVAMADGLQRGVRAYVGKNKDTIVKVPEELAGATLLRTNQDDAGKQDKDFLSFETNVDATVYVAYDSRYATPTWLKDGFEESDRVVTTSQAKGDKPGKKGGHLKVYEKPMKAGKITLGGNKGKGGKDLNMYVVFLKKSGGAGKTTEAAAKAALAKANAKHGEEIFFGRGTCFACHKVKDKGVVIGPDLVNISKRRDVNYVIASIVDPDAYIVEGFQQTSLELKDGSKVFGMIQEETAQSIQIFLLTGQQVTVETKNVKKRDDAKNSGMPSSFAHTLSPQDVADLSAWIMTLK
jgi:putative membrane-bound dehydrogenase-like protein